MSDDNMVLLLVLWVDKVFLADCVVRWVGDEGGVMSKDCKVNARSSNVSNSHSTSSALLALFRKLTSVGDEPDESGWWWGGGDELLVVGFEVVVAVYFSLSVWWGKGKVRKMGCWLNSTILLWFPPPTTFFLLLNPWFWWFCDSW